MRRIFSLRSERQQQSENESELNEVALLLFIDASAFLSGQERRVMWGRIDKDWEDLRLCKAQLHHLSTTPTKADSLNTKERNKCIKRLRLAAIIFLLSILIATAGNELSLHFLRADVLSPKIF